MGGDKGQLTAEDGQESEERAGRGTKQAAHVNRRHFRLIMKRFSERLRVAAGVWLPSQTGRLQICLVYRVSADV